MRKQRVKEKCFLLGTLSLGTGPLLPEGEGVSNKASKQDQKRDQRPEFLRAVPPRTTLGEYIEPVQQPDK